jgi:hypothetical protein
MDLRFWSVVKELKYGDFVPTDFFFLNHLKIKYKVLTHIVYDQTGQNQT